MYFGDPDNHLRIRFRTSKSKYSSLLTAWSKALIPYQESGLIKRVQLDTYERELERYRPALINQCEAIFQADSFLLLNWLTQLDSPTEDDRYGLALLSVDALLTDFDFTIDDKVKISQRLQRTFFQEQHGTKALKQKLNQLYRDRQNTLFNQPQLTCSLVAERSRMIYADVKLIREYFLKTPTDKDYNQFVASLIHMAINRIFQGQARRHELIVYHFLARRYESAVALAKLPK